MIHSEDPSTLTWCSYTNMNLNLVATLFNIFQTVTVEQTLTSFKTIGFNRETMGCPIFILMAMILVAVTHRVWADGIAVFQDLVVLFLFGLMVGVLNPFRYKGAFNNRWMPHDVDGPFPFPFPFVNRRLVFLRWYSLLCSFVVMFLFAVLYSHDGDRTRIEYLMVGVDEVFYGTFKDAVATSRLRSMCQWPCDHNQLGEMASFVERKDFENVYTPEDLLWHQSLYLHMRVRKHLVWVLIGFFTRIVTILGMDLIECRMKLLENFQTWDGAPATRKRKTAQVNPRIQTPDDPLVWNYGVMLAATGAGWSFNDFSQVIRAMTVAENSMITVMLTDVTLRSCVDMAALVWVAMNVLVPMAVGYYGFFVRSFCEERSMTRRRSEWDAHACVAFASQSVLFWTVACCACMAYQRWPQVRACVGPWVHWLYAIVLNFCVLPLIWMGGVFTICQVFGISWSGFVVAFVCLPVFHVARGRWGWALPTLIVDGGMCLPVLHVARGRWGATLTVDGGSGNSSPIDGGSGNSSPAQRYI